MPVTGCRLAVDTDWTDWPWTGLTGGLNYWIYLDDKHVVYGYMMTSNCQSGELFGEQIEPGILSHRTKSTDESCHNFGN